MTMVNSRAPNISSSRASRTMVQPPNICDPTDDQCVRPVEPFKLPGISVRHSPSCTGTICNLFACDGGNWRVTREGTLDRAEWIKGWAITQLFTPRYMSCQEHPLGLKRGGWWADSFRIGPESNFISGSRLYALGYMQGGARNELLMQAQDYAFEALQYLTGWGIASSINTSAQWATRGSMAQMTMHLHVDITGPSISFTTEGTGTSGNEWLWREYLAPKALTALPGRHYRRVAYQ